MFSELELAGKLKKVRKKTFSQRGGTFPMDSPMQICVLNGKVSTFNEKFTDFRIDLLRELLY